jgi:non-ribosomal peptide synthetase component F
MVELTLVSKHERPLRPLVEAALANEIRLLEAGMRQTRQRLAELEAHHGMSTDDFIRRFEDDELDETLDLIEWMGEYRLLQRLQDKANTLREIEFAN